MPQRILSVDEKNRAADMSTDYALGFEQAMAEFGVTREGLTDALLDVGIEQCPCCKSWVESHELIAPDSEDGITPDGHCRNCRPLPKD